MKKKNPRISVIIPVYNVGPLLEKCLESISNQTFEDFEVLVVNDCSPDDSAEIARSYSEKDPRVKVIDKPQNEGTMEARRTGYETASGDYIMFCDGDDYLPPDALQRSLEYIDGQPYDMVLTGCTYIPLKGEAKTITRSNVEVNSREDIYKALIDRQMKWFLCSGIYDKKLFSERLETFKGQCLNEDYMILLQLMQYTDRVKIVNEPLYVYCRRADSSAIDALNFSKMRQELFANAWCLDFLESRDILQDNARKHYIRRVVKSVELGFTKKQIMSSGLVKRDVFTLSNIRRYNGMRYVLKYWWHSTKNGISPKLKEN